MVVHETVKMANNTSKSVHDVAITYYEQLMGAIAGTIDTVLAKLVSLQVVNRNDVQMIKNESTDQLQAECLLERCILNRVEAGDDQVLHKLLQVLMETRKCNDVVTKICNELDIPPPSLSQ